MDNGRPKCKRVASACQREIDDTNYETELGQLEHAEKVLQRKKKQLLLKQAGNTSDDDVESQDEVDEGQGRIAGGGFTSAISSQGVVQAFAAKKPMKWQLFREHDEEETMSDPSVECRLHQPSHGPNVNTLRQTQSSPPPTRRSPEWGDNLLDFGEEDNVNGPVQSPLSPNPTSTGISTQQSVGFHRSCRSTSRATDSPLPPSKRVKLPPAPFRDGKTPSKNARASDYDEGVEKMLLNASHEFACLVFTANAFPDDETQIKWARTIWKNACERVDSHYELSHRMMRLITEHCSWAHGLLKDAVCEHFHDHFKFKKGAAATTKEYNINLCQSLLNDDAFHHKDPETGTGFGESPIIADIIETALFKDTTGHGVHFSKYFNPIPSNLLALVFTIIEFLINEYKSGEKVKAPFCEKYNHEKFEKHVWHIEEWTSLNERVTTNIRAKLFKKLMKRAGASNGQPTATSSASGMTSSMREKAQQALNSRSGDTDSSENE